MAAVIGVLLVLAIAFWILSKIAGGIAEIPMLLLKLWFGAKYLCSRDGRWWGVAALVGSSALALFTEPAFGAGTMIGSVIAAGASITEEAERRLRGR